MRKFSRIFVIALVLLMMFSIPDNTFAQSREQLEQELANIEAQIKALNDSINDAKKQGSTLKSEIDRLAKEIVIRKNLIQAKSRIITQLSHSISEKNNSIKVLDSKIGREKESLGQIMRKTRYLEQYSVLDFGLQSSSLSSFFSDADSFSTLNRALNQSFAELRTTKGEIQEAKEQLEEAKDNETQKKLSLENEKRLVEQNQKEQSQLLAITKNKEAAYAKEKVAREKEAASIRARLFELRDAGSISFGKAYDLAVLASKGTGVRPALILAILMQESSLGINVGACYLRDTSTGDGVSIKTGASKPRTMSPSRDVPVFVSLLNRLNYSVEKTPVSCWIPMYSRGAPVGWGGAMGPSQFIPSTWVLFEDRIERITGASLANPWDPRDAITATALYLADLGAVAGNESSERNAACKYYSGKSCSSSSAGAGYGNSVMRKLYSTQQDIDKLQR
jgi:peptidoglycan hydrolase CwlO-like protein